MSVVVQKYGGSSMATPEKISKVAQRVSQTHAAGHQVVVVVSAMGDTTNRLLDLARSVSPNAHRRELDMLVTVGERISMSLLSMAIQDLGLAAVSFTGSQSGIITTPAHTNARIIRVTPYRIRQALDDGRIVIVAGFQGVSEHKEITSLGRGGSDTTAVALAAALGAAYAEICSDVDGVHSADPRAVPEARRLPEITYGAMQALADAGAKVLHVEAIEWARRSGIELRCVSTDGSAGAGTTVRDRPPHEHPRVVAVTQHRGLLCLEAARPGEAMPPELPGTLSAHGVGESEVWCMPGQAWGALVPCQNLHALAPLLEALGALEIAVRRDLTLVTVVGRSLASAPSVVPRAQACLSAGGISLRGQLTSASRVAFLVDRHDGEAAVRALHRSLFGGSP